MSLALAALLTASTAIPAALPACSWNRPGHNPFMGDVVAAVDRYPDIPAPVRARLKQRMASRAYDEIVSIRRDAIVGKARYSPEIRDMHFGSGQVCGTVNRKQWQNDAQERGLVYCEAGHCILVPTVCRNVSRISRESPAVADAGSAGGAAGGGAAGGGGAGDGAGAAPGLAWAAAAPAEAGLGQEAAAPASFVAGLMAPESAGAWPAGPGEGLSGTAGPSGMGTGAWPGPGAWALGVGPTASGGPAPDTAELRPPRFTTGVDGDGSVEANPGGLPGPGRGVVNGGSPLSVETPTLAVPEPGSWALMLAGLAALAWRARRRVLPFNPA